MALFGPVEQIGVEIVAQTGRFFGQVDGAVNKAQGRFSGMAQRIGKAVQFGIAGTGLALVGLGGAAFKLGLDFERQMTNIAAQTNIPAESVRGLRDQILALSKEMAIAPAELAAGAYFVLSAGFDKAADAANVLREAAKLTTIGLGSTDVTARALTQTLKAYGAGSEQAAKFADIFIGTVKAGAAEADELAGSLSNVVPFAAQLGVEFPVVAGALAQMTNKGFSTAEATVALNQLFSQLISPSDDLTDSLERMGFAADDLIKGLRTDALGTLTKIAAGAEESGETVTLFANNVRAARAFVGAFGTGAAETAQLVAQLSDEQALAAGSAQSLATVQETAGFKLKKAVNLINVELTKLGLVLLPALAAGAQLFTDNFGRLAAFVRSNLTPVLIGLAAALTVVSVALAPLAAGLAVTLAPILGFVALAAAIGAAFYLLEKRTKFFSETLLPALRRFGEAALPVLRDFGRAALDLGRDIGRFLAPALDTLADLWANLRPLLLAAADAFASHILPVLRTVGDFLLEHKKIIIAVAGVILLLTNPWLAVAAAVAVVLAKWDEISALFTRTIPAAIDSLLAKIRGIPIIGELFEQAWENAVTVVRTAVQLIVNRVEFLVESVRNTIRFFSAILSGDWGKAWDALRDQVNAIFELLKGDFLALFTGLASIVSGSLSTFVEIGGQIAAAIADVVSGIPGALLDILKKHVTPANMGKAAAVLVAILIPPILVAALIVRFRKQIGGFFSKLPGLFKAALGGVAGALLDNWFTIVNILFPPSLLWRFRDQIVELLKEAPGAILSGLSTIASALQANWFTIVAILFPPALLVRFRQAIAEFLGEMATALVQFATETVPAWIGDLATAFIALKPWEWVKDAVSAFVDGFIDALLGLFGLSFINDWLDGLRAFFETFFKPWDWVSQGIADFVSLLVGAFEGLVTSIGDTFEDIKRAALSPILSLETEIGIVWDRIVLLFSTIGGALLGGFKIAVNDLFIGPLNTVIRAINSIPDIELPFGRSLRIPDIPTVPPVRAGGGPVAAGQLYQVNERGIEFFRPFQAGTVLPLAPAGAGDSSRRWTNYGKVINVYGPGRTSRDVLWDLDQQLR